MTFNSQITLKDYSKLDIPIKIGSPMFILGANGSGKSSLILYLNYSNKEIACTVNAHRQVYLESSRISLSAEQKNNQDNQVFHHQNSPQARYREPQGISKVQILLYNFIETENKHARKIAEFFYNKDTVSAEKYSYLNQAPIIVINDILIACNIPISIKIDDTGDIVAIKNGGAPFSAAELSDGERSAFLIGISILTAKAGTLFLIDEPERHLHRSIVLPLLKQLFMKRNDCAFVISTHDLALPLEYENASCLLVRSCSYNPDTSDAMSMQFQPKPMVWEADILEPHQEIDNELKASIIGSRRKILFIEGCDNSL